MSQNNLQHSGVTELTNLKLAQPVSVASSLP
jgi:hypothetical protein